MLNRVLIVLLLGILTPGTSLAAPLLASVSPRDGILRIIDAADASTVDSSVVLTLSGEIVLGATGMALDPQTGVVYAFFKLLGVPNRELVTLDLQTGVATSVGNTGDKFATMTFASNGTLYGMTGEGAATPQSLYILSTADASKTFEVGFGAPIEEVTDGEALAFNSSDGQLYRGSGIGPPNTNETFDKVDPGTLAVVNVPLSGVDYEELTALLYLDDGFYAADLGNAQVDIPKLHGITTTGVVSLVGSLDHVSKGLVPLPPPVPAMSPPAMAVLTVSLMFGAAYFGKALRGKKS